VNKIPRILREFPLLLEAIHNYCCDAQLFEVYKNFLIVQHEKDMNGRRICNIWVKRVCSDRRLSLPNSEWGWWTHRKDMRKAKKCVDNLLKEGDEREHLLHYKIDLSLYPIGGTDE